MKKIIVILLLVWTAACPAGVLPWTTLENCHLLPNNYNDGDSFHVEKDGKEYIFRLYFVDTPETELYLRTRVQEQADYFGVSFDNMMEIGKQSTEFVRQQLSGPFTVYTKWHSAQGRSSMPRYYALIRAGDRDLGEMLVEHGLARVYGVRVNTPEGVSVSAYLAHLLQMQRQARKAKNGAWVYARAIDENASEDPLAQFKSIICPRSLPVYSSATPRQRLGNVARKTTVYVLEEFPDGWVHIRYRGEPGDITDAYCLRWDLSLPDLPAGTR